MHPHKPFLTAFFRMITDQPMIMVIAGLAVVLVTGFGLTRLIKDTSVDAFVPTEHPSVVANEKTAEVFGLTDSIAVAVTTTDGGSVFRPRVLTLIQRLTLEISQLPNVREDRVASLATESAISGEDGMILVDPYIEAFAIDEADAAASAGRWRLMPPHIGTLVTKDETGAAIMAELINSRLAADTYANVQKLVADASADDVEILVAGPAAVSGYLSHHIDRDAGILQPLVFCVVLVFLYFAFRRGAALLGPVIVVLGAAGGALGIMAWQGVPYYAITNALPVILVAISVADAIHILSAYYQLKAKHEQVAVQELVARAMAEVARPITLTTLTTIAGFIGIGAVSIMPPIQYFAWYAALGVALAWVFSILVLPSVIVLLKLKPSPAFTSWRQRKPDALGRFFVRIGIFSITRPTAVLAAFFLIVIVAATGAMQLRIDRSQVDNFAADEPIRVADERINAAFAGTAFLDVLVETDEPEGLLDKLRMAKIARLQNYLEGLPHVQKTVSIADYVSLLHSAIEGVPARADRPLPAQDGVIPQYLMVYEASGAPTDFEEEISPNHETALVRGVMNTPYFSETRGAVEALERYLAERFNEPGLRATLAGDVNVAYHWMTRLQRTHFLGVALSLVLVLAMAVFVFRSLGAGLVAVVPVTFTVLVLYGVMGYLGINLEPATSMFAAISVGVGVDFAIHFVDRLRVALRVSNNDLQAAVIMAMPTTARACFFNAAALGVGFSVLLASNLPTLQRFGGLVTVAALASFLAALVMVPALYAAGQAVRLALLTGDRRRAVRLSVIPLTLGGLMLMDTPVEAASLNGREIAENVAARPEGHAAKRLIHMTLTDRHGRSRERQAWVLRRNDEEVRRTRITYVAPKSVREVAFLSHDFQQAGRSDHRWLYLPAARKVRRIPTSDRGDYFLGTDFTYADMQSDLKFDVADYEFRYEGQKTVRGRVVHHISGEPITDKIARELGYGGFDALIDEASWMPVTIRFLDLKRELLKTIEVLEIRQVDGIWTALEITANNHKSNHRTVFRYRAVEYPDTLPDTVFQSSALSRGVPSP